ncbi:MAG: hypothetical protein ACJ73D_01635 [Pyrinomonadaceae bacterium]
MLMDAGSRAPNDPRTGEPIDRLEDRISDVVAEWQGHNEKVIIPTPVLSEFLVLAADDASDYLDEIDSSTHFVVRAFDTKAAVELSAMYLAERSQMSNTAKKKDTQADTKAKMKFDRQIVAIAKANRATAIYSDDDGVAAFAERHNISVIRTWDLPAPQTRAVRLPGIEEEDEQAQERAAEPSSTDGGGSSESVTPDKARASEAAQGNEGNEEEKDPEKSGLNAG